jgi:hypothetical protein
LQMSFCSNRRPAKSRRRRGRRSQTRIREAYLQGFITVLIPRTIAPLRASTPCEKPRSRCTLMYWVFRPRRRGRNHNQMHSRDAKGGLLHETRPVCELSGNQVDLEAQGDIGQVSGGGAACTPMWTDWWSAGNGTSRFNRCHWAACGTTIKSVIWVLLMGNIGSHVDITS